MVPVDGRIVDAVAVLDESVLTGEPLQVERAAGEPVRSGVVNAGTAFELRATATAQDSTYAGIVRLAQQAGAESAPIVRLADRYAAWFVPLALADRGRCVAGQRIGCTGGRGPGGGDAVPAAARGAGGDRLRAVAGLTSGRGDPQRRRTGKPRARNDSGDGQDRHPHDGAPGRRRGRWPHPDATPPRYCGWRRRWIRCRRMCWPRPSSPKPSPAGLRLSLPTDVIEEPGRGVTATIDDRRVQVGKLPSDAVDADWARAAVNRATPGFGRDRVGVRR